MTIFSLYRVISIPGTLKLSTITDLYSGDLVSLSRLSWELANFARFRKGEFRVRKFSGVTFLETASSTSSVSWTNLLWDYYHIKDYHPAIYTELMKTLKFFSVMDLLSIAKQLDETNLRSVIRHPQKLGSNVSGPLGQLSIKEEAAGKLRVFALVDFWTQNALKPLHESIFSFLRTLPNDATFNQGLAVKRAMEKAKYHGQSFGYDLSAATDRLPISLQVSILNSIFGRGFGDS